ncbi:MAG: hypothetical protein U5O39_19655 [Gammaproteobacteria bacterium]|nr:hypothetical protein [Gammaproteobacteria bacterium]
MAVGPSKVDYLPVAGVSLAAVAAGIKRSDTPDLVLLAFDEGSETAAYLLRVTSPPHPLFSENAISPRQRRAIS